MGAARTCARREAVQFPVVQAYVYRADAAAAQLVLEKDVPAKVLPPHVSGCAIVLALGALTTLASLVLARQVGLP